MRSVDHTARICWSSASLEKHVGRRVGAGLLQFEVGAAKVSHHELVLIVSENMASCTAS